jgi:hypothetical protein
MVTYILKAFLISKTHKRRADLILDVKIARNKRVVVSRNPVNPV